MCYGYRFPFVGSNERGNSAKVLGYGEKNSGSVYH